MSVLGSRDADGRPWASIVFGEPGFLTANDGRRVNLDLKKTIRNPFDPLWENVAGDPQVGMLAIDLSTRRRLRVNGALRPGAATHMALEVSEAYPNCPKYIQRRRVSVQTSDRSDAPPRIVEQGSQLTSRVRDVIAAADTFFVASAHPERGADASHRGGRRGFVHVIDGTRMRVPDYVGNSMFNTLGNLSVYPRAGLAFYDFDRRRTLQLTGRTEILWDEDDDAGETGGTRRFWDFIVERWIETETPAAPDWEFLDASPLNPQPGSSSRAPAI